MPAESGSARPRPGSMSSLFPFPPASTTGRKTPAAAFGSATSILNWLGASESMWAGVYEMPRAAGEPTKPWFRRVGSEIR
jgi:hypothetical protein